MGDYLNEVQRVGQHCTLRAHNLEHIIWERSSEAGSNPLKNWYLTLQSKRLRKFEIELVKKAHKIAEKAHSGQFRKSGEPYISHPLSVALIIAELKLDYLCIVAAILHDCIEDTSVTKDDVKAQFGEQVAHIVEGVSKLTKFRSCKESSVGAVPAN